MRRSRTRDVRIPAPLPRHFLRHTAIFLTALAIFFIMSPELGVTWVPDVVKLLVGIAAWFVAAFYFGYYVCAYPIIHAAQRYRGPNQTTWLILLSIDLFVSFGIVRVCYFVAQILPDIRKSAQRTEFGAAA